MESVLFEGKFDRVPMMFLFEKTFKLISQKLGDQAFTRFNIHGEATGRLAPAYYEAVCVAFVERYDDLVNVSADILLSRLRTAFESEGFKDATGPGANTITKLHQRIRVVREHLCDEIPA